MQNEYLLYTILASRIIGNVRFGKMIDRVVGDGHTPSKQLIVVGSMRTNIGIIRRLWRLRVDDQGDEDVRLVEEWTLEQIHLSIHLGQIKRLVVDRLNS